MHLVCIFYFHCYIVHMQSLFLYFHTTKNHIKPKNQKTKKKPIGSIDDFRVNEN